MRRFIVALVSLWLAIGGSVRAQSLDVDFPSLDPKFKGQLTARLYTPLGDGPFPAMVLLHTCAGVQGFVIGWASWFVDRGYAALVLDSFGPRTVASVCGVGGYPDENVRALDAYGALAYLKTRSDIDPKRIGMIGWSHGGGAVLAADAKGLADARAPEGGFRAAIALYPVCGYMPRNAVAAPLLVLFGAKDDWTGVCDRDIAALARAGAPASDYVEPDATHAFDNPTDKGRVQYGRHSYTLIYNEAAAKDAHERVAAFLADVMK